MDIKATKGADMEQFLVDVRAHFRASLETSEYENTSNLFHVTDGEKTLQLLMRCELLLAQYAAEQATGAAPPPAPISDCVDSRESASARESENGCYLAMLSTASPASRKSLSASREYVDIGGSSASVQSDKTFHSSCLEKAKVEEEQQLYDICQSLRLDDDDEREKVMTAELIDCPFKELPAGHLAISGAAKYGQLQRIEKRLFFDQSKKCFCGILNDWMLCYAEGPTSCRPSSSLHLKSPAIEIEHFGEGKRRDICFQISTADPSKKFVYQAGNEVDAKEWIHAIEAAIRGDVASSLKTPRKLPTPPVMKKSNYLAEANDSIYEEPSPIYQLSQEPPRLPEKCNSPDALARRFEYDIPKSPPQAIAEPETETMTSMPSSPIVETVETAVLLNRARPQASSLHGSLKLEAFQAKLSSQLSAGGQSPERLKKTAKKSYSCGSPEGGESLSLSPSLKEQKKQRKSQQTPTPPTSPQKTTPSKDCDKLARNWFLSRLNKTTTRLVAANNSQPANGKCKHSEKENLLNGSANLELGECDALNDLHLGSKEEAKSKVNMIINQFESSGHLFSVEALAANALASLTSFCEGDNNCNNYEPIMPLATTPSSFLKKV